MDLADPDREYIAWCEACRGYTQHRFETIARHLFETGPHPFWEIGFLNPLCLKCGRLNQVIVFSETESWVSIIKD